MNPELTESSVVLVLTALHLSLVEELLAGWPGLSSWSRQVEAREEMWARWENWVQSQVVEEKAAAQEAPPGEAHQVPPS